MQHHGTPRVSILMTTYNTGPMVRETIDAILAQTFTDWELVIVDDCSTDNTPALIQAYDDPRIRFQRNETNQGISRTRNTAIGLARGDYIAATDHDDISLPQRLEQQVSYLDAHPATALVATAAKELRNGRLSSRYPGELRSHILDWRLHTRCGIVHSSICYRRDLLQQHGLHYRPEYHYAEDFVLFSELSDLGDIVVLPDELVVYREIDGNASSQHNATMNRNGMSWLQQRYRDRLGIDLTMDQISALWGPLNNSSTPADTSQLIRVGQLYARILERYLECKSWSVTQAEDIRQFASLDWWRMVAIFCQMHGRFDVQALYRTIPELSSWRPGMIALGKTLLKSSLRRLRSSP